MFANLFSRLRSDRTGQDLIEYVLMGALVAVAAGGLMPGVADGVSAVFSQVGSVATTAAGSSQDSILQGDTVYTRQ
jgi:Flp pilus assembly pilin Flp